MDLQKILTQLHAELEYLDAAIASLENLQQQGRRLGRPPKALAALRRPRKISTRESSATAAKNE